jgi:hypothetical protein
MLQLWFERELVLKQHCWSMQQPTTLGLSLAQPAGGWLGACTTTPAMYMCNMHNGISWVQRLSAVARSTYGSGSGAAGLGTGCTVAADWVRAPGLAEVRALADGC